MHGEIIKYITIKEDTKMKRRVRKTKRMFRKLWKEWGVTREEIEMFICAVGVFLLPMILRLIIFFL